MVVHPRRLIVFTRFPEPGKVKTRLAAAIGAEGAARFQRRATEHVIERARDLQQTIEIDIEVSFDGGDEERMEHWLGADLTYRQQAPGDIGERMWRDFEAAFGAGAKQVVLVGTDCPNLATRHLDDAFVGLEDADLVLGPALDGGYYLVALRRPLQLIFVDIPWGTDLVLASTLAIAVELHRPVRTIGKLLDVDRPEDLERVPRRFRAQDN